MSVPYELEENKIKRGQLKKSIVPSSCNEIAVTIESQLKKLIGISINSSSLEVNKNSYFFN